MTGSSAGNPRWAELTRRTFAEIAECEPIYRPTTFWRTGVETLMDDMQRRGLPTFKSWPSAREWFYPRYGDALPAAAIDAALAEIRRRQPGAPEGWIRGALAGTQQARRDYDALRLAWDHERWPFDLEGLGESLAGSPPQAIRLGGSTTAVLTRPYLNYMLLLAGLSRHVDAPPARFLELGGGFGVLGEIVMSRDPNAVYVGLDIPPLLTVASSYLDTLFGDRVATYESLPGSGPLDVSGAACLPNWRIRDLRGTFDVFVNSYSFQEMEPDVVARYVDDVARLSVEWIVSLNSRAGKVRQDEANPIGVITPVTSADIIGGFEAHGYEHVASYGEPLLQSQGELAILRRGGGGRRERAAGGTADRMAPQSARVPTAAPGVDLRQPFMPPMRVTAKTQPPRWRSRVARRLLPQSVLKAIRARRRRRQGGA